VLYVSGRRQESDDNESGFLLDKKAVKSYRSQRQMVNLQEIGAYLDETWARVLVSGILDGAPKGSLGKKGEVGRFQRMNRTFRQYPVMVEIEAKQICRPGPRLGCHRDPPIDDASRGPLIHKA
jgi:hypothetical protein